MSKWRLIITSTISIVLVSILLIGSTYSIFTTTEIDEELNVYKTGNLDITYTLSESNINFTNSTPMTEEEADGVTPYRITVTNSGNVPYMFDVILSDTTSSSNNTIDYQYIMTKVGYLTPKKLSNCPSNIIKEDIILPAGESVDIDVRVWLSDNISNSEIGKSFYAKLSIDGLAVYNDNTDIDNSILSLKYMKELFPYTFDDFFDEELEPKDFTIQDYFKRETYNSYIKTASFVDYINITNVVEYWDVSEKGDNSVVAWVENNDTQGYYDLYIGSKYKIYAESLNMFFFNSNIDYEGMEALETIIFNNLDTSLTKNMSTLFCQLYNLTELDLSSFDTNNVTNMSHMFDSLELTELDLIGFNTRKVTNMYGMFSNCKGLTSLDLSSFDTSKVTSMADMFLSCESLTSLDLSNFDTSNVTNMSWMFSGCSSLTSLDLSSFDTSSVKNMSFMFFICNSLTSLDLSSFDTSNVTNMEAMFEECVSLTELDLSSFDTSNVTNMSWMFSVCSSLTSLDLSSFDTSNVTIMLRMFYKCSSLTTEITIINSGVSRYGYMFYGASIAEGAQITVNYTSTTSDLVDSMIATKSEDSNVVKGELVA